jgi:hypothetical protein
MTNILIYKDGPNQIELIQHVNRIHGAVVSSPAENLPGDWEIIEILNFQLTPAVSPLTDTAGWMIVALVAIRNLNAPAFNITSRGRSLVDEIGALTPDGEHLPIGI